MVSVRMNLMTQCWKDVDYMPLNDELVCFEDGGKTTYTYDELSRMISETTGKSSTIRCTYDKKEIEVVLRKQFSDSLDFTLDEIRKGYVFDSRTAYTVPVAIKAFLESACYEDAIRKAVPVGGDSDTIACMTGGIAQAYYKEIPKEIFGRGSSILDTGRKRVLNEFEDRYKVKR